MEEAKIAIFKGKRIRKTLHENEWWFVIEDVVEELSKGWGQIATPLSVPIFYPRSRK